MVTIHFLEIEFMMALIGFPFGDHKRGSLFPSAEIELIIVIPASGFPSISILTVTNHALESTYEESIELTKKIHYHE